MTAFRVHCTIAGEPVIIRIQADTPEAARKEAIRTASGSVVVHKVKLDREAA